MDNYKINPLVEQFDEPLYPVLLEDIPKGSKLVNGVVIFTNNQNQDFDFGKLGDIILHWPVSVQNNLKDRIKKAIFEVKKNSVL